MKCLKGALFGIALGPPIRKEGGHQSYRWLSLTDSSKGFKEFGQVLQQQQQQQQQQEKGVEVTATCTRKRRKLTTSTQFPGDPVLFQTLFAFGRTCSTLEVRRSTTSDVTT